jgi:hypothetical protein
VSHLPPPATATGNLLVILESPVVRYVVKRKLLLVMI